VVEIKVTQEVSDVHGTGDVGNRFSNNLNTQAGGTFAVPNGATVALGGLINSTRSISRTGVPLLMDIPLVGDLFASTADVTRRSEPIVLLRPSVINSRSAELDLSRSLSEALQRVRPEWFKPAQQHHIVTADLRLSPRSAFALHWRWCL